LGAERGISILGGIWLSGGILEFWLSGGFWLGLGAELGSLGFSWLPKKEVKKCEAWDSNLGPLDGSWCRLTRRAERVILSVTRLPALHSLSRKAFRKRRKINFCTIAPIKKELRP
jgi:hypothetical protein